MLWHPMLYRLTTLTLFGDNIVGELKISTHPRVALQVAPHGALLYSISRYFCICGLH